MAVEYGWTGFEQGEADFAPLAPLRGGIIGCGIRGLRPRTGQFCLSDVSGDSTVNSWTAYRRKNTTLGTGLGVGNSATSLARVFFRIIENPSTDDCGVLCVGTPSNPGNGSGNLSITAARFWKVWSHNRFSSLSAAALDLYTWYRADITHTVTQTDATHFGTSTSVSVYTEGGALIETLAQTNSTTPLGAAALPIDISLGNGTAFFSARYNEFDDWWWGSADGADLATLAFPAVAMRITRVPATAQGSVAQWTGDFRTVTDFPRENVATDEQSNAVATQQTLFTKASAASLGISGIEGVIVRAQMRSTASSGAESLMLGGTAYTVTVPTAYANLGVNGVNYGTIPEATFDGWEFGARNDRGTGLRLATCYLEVLHGGSSQPAPFTDVVDTFRINLKTHTGNGGYQTVTGMGFGSQLLILLPSSSSLASGAFKQARLGGTYTQGFEPGGTRSMNGVLAITSDGYQLGPNNNTNLNTVQYLAIGICDGGLGIGGRYFDSLTRIGSLVDNYSVIFGDGFTPDIAWNQALQNGATIIRTTPMGAGDIAVAWPGGLAGVQTNLIQAFEATGFQVGSNSVVNGTNILMQDIILRLGAQLTNYIHIGTMTPGGSTATITGIPFTPVFVMCQRSGNNGSGAWRSSLMTNHTGTTSTTWANGSTISNGITSITADGFTIGSALATAGTPVFWIALAPGSVPIGCGPVTFPLGTDSGGGAGCLPALATGADSGGGAGCAVSL